jgi:CBS-domain-containing membrane protein
MFLDPTFSRNKLRYVLQCGLGTLSMLLILLVLNRISVSAVVASMGASCFISFLMPHSHPARPRSLIGGYVVGTLFGCLFNSLSLFPAVEVLLGAWQDPHILMASLAVGLSMFVMVVTNTEHPPAAGLALGLVFDDITRLTIVIILTGIISLTIIKTLLKPYLIDLM